MAAGPGWRLPSRVQPRVRSLCSSLVLHGTVLGPLSVCPLQSPGTGTVSQDVRRPEEGGCTLGAQGPELSFPDSEATPSQGSVTGRPREAG